MAQFITDIFAQLDKKRALLSAGTKEKRDTVTVNWGGMLYNKRVFLLRSVILCLFVSFLFSVACTACGEAAVPFVRIDRDKLNGSTDLIRILNLPQKGWIHCVFWAVRSFRGHSSGGLLLSCGNALKARTYMLLICTGKPCFC